MRLLSTTSRQVITLSGPVDDVSEGIPMPLLHRPGVRHSFGERLGFAERVEQLLEFFGGFGFDAAGEPVVAAVEGGAFGAGLAMMAACDRVVASQSARFGTAFAKIGLAGDAGVFWSLPRRVGPARARQLLMLSTEVPAQEAHAIGLVDALAEPGKALWSALADAARLAAGPPIALATIKYLLNQGPTDLHAVLDAETERQAALFDTEDLAEGLTAFRERRPPAFRGK